MSKETQAKMEEAEARIRAARVRAARVRARARAIAEQQAKRPRRTKPGVKALREIRKYQNRTDLLIPKTRFVRVCKEVLQDNLLIRVRVRGFER